MTVLLALVLAACGGGDSGGDNPDTGTADTVVGAAADNRPSPGDVVDPQEPGHATVTVEGKEYSLDVSPAVDCSIAAEAVTFAFWVGDNSVVLGGGANLYEDGWLGSIDLRISEPEGQNGPIAYFPDQDSLSDGIAVDGDSMSYSGPMMKQPPNDGSNPPPVDVGSGTISVTCG